MEAVGVVQIVVDVFRIGYVFGDRLFGGNADGQQEEDLLFLLQTEKAVELLAVDGA